MKLGRSGVERRIEVMLKLASLVQEEISEEDLAELKSLVKELRMEVQDREVQKKAGDFISKVAPKFSKAFVSMMGLT